MNAEIEKFESLLYFTSKEMDEIVWVADTAISFATTTPVGGTARCFLSLTGLADLIRLTLSAKELLRNHTYNSLPTPILFKVSLTGGEIEANPFSLLRNAHTWLSSPHFRVPPVLCADAT
mmetsp:Transcript_44918/g.88361  ORF Transcript_44918/g.88361 Transcript_44918/m.88361 type:complete len:120 (+) Transcript_44918:1020-1379(+)